MQTNLFPFFLKKNKSIKIDFNRRMSIVVDLFLIAGNLFSSMVDLDSLNFLQICNYSVDRIFINHKEHRFHRGEF
jgi:hypothetical protein